MCLYLLQDDITENSKNICICCDIVLAQNKESLDDTMKYIWECL